MKASVLALTASLVRRGEDYCAQNLAAMTERSDTEVFQVLVCQIAENREIDIVVGKALGVLGHSELFEPISNLLHRQLPATIGAESLPLLATAMVGRPRQRHAPKFRSNRPGHYTSYHCALVIDESRPLPLVSIL